MTLRDAIDRLFEESIVRPWASLTGMGRGMSVDVYDQDDHIMVEATLPGVKPEDVDIRVEGNMLTIKAEKKQEKDISEDRYTYRERSYGMMQRSLILPSAVKAEGAEAKMENGELKLSLPKAEEARARRIQVKAAS
ncbi:MAG: Hsp20/alpha crystallin family protein [Anaerolineae bacterium]|nr:Hsp20/alpha crystallin family protein [Anaerolineae bacterium]